MAPKTPLSDTIQPDGNNEFPPVPPADIQEYRKVYNLSIEQREDFWEERGHLLDWEKTYETIVEESFNSAKIEWFVDGELNACINAVDRHCSHGHGKDTALTEIRTGDKNRTFTFEELRSEVINLAAALKAEGLKRGDRIALYMPNSPEMVFFMLAASRLGVIFTPIPIQYSAESVNDIVENCEPKLLVVSYQATDETYVTRAKAAAVMANNAKVVAVGEVHETGAVSYTEFLTEGSDATGVPHEAVSAEHPLFILYANTAAGIPRGSVFATGGYLAHSVSSYLDIFGGVDDGNILFTAVSLAGVAGQSYGFWGALCAGAQLIITEREDNPTSECLKAAVEQNTQPSLLMSPRRIGSLKRELKNGVLSEKGRFSIVACTGDALSPRFVRYAGEALNGDANKVLNLWIQSESGCSLINTYPIESLNRPGALGVPAYGIQANAINQLGDVCRTNESGQLMFPVSWPGMIRTIWGQHDRFVELYFRRMPGYFATNDGVRMDGEGFYWFMGRLDDVVKIRGQSLATSEIEAALMANTNVNEAAVLSVTDDQEEEKLVAFIVPGDYPDTDRQSLKTELNDYIERRIGEYAIPESYVFSDELPRTRTGKLVRRLLRRIASGGMQTDEDLSHVANPNSVEKLISAKGPE